MNKSVVPTTAITPEFLAQLAQRFGSMLDLGASTRARFGSDESHHTPVPPDAVVTAKSTQDVVDIVTLCDAFSVPVIPYGTGTGLEGSVIAVRGGVAINFQEMNDIIQINPQDLDVVVQPGVTRIQLNRALKEYGLFFPVDPGANASIGGMTSTRA